MTARPLRPPLRGLLEYGLYVEDVVRAADFYRRVFGFPALVEDERMCALGVEGSAVLLLFAHGSATEPIELPGGVLPPHDARGRAHLAFAIDEAELDAWASWLEELDVEIESHVEWGRGGRSLYFRDPDGHLLELVTPGTWEIW